MATNGKDTIYIDIDDEITTIIEKVRASDGSIVALVLPKRATVLQSIVNMKLLKRSADNAKKNIVLITAEAGLLPLAGTVGLYVAKSLQSKPEIPGVSGQDDAEEFADEADDNDDAFNVSDAANRPVGELASRAGVPLASEEAIETLQLDDEADEPAESEVASSTDAPTAKKPKKNKKLAVPNFNKFRTRLLLGIPALILLIVGLYLATNVLPKASVTITTDTSNINSSLTLNLDTVAKTLDAAKLVVPAQLQKVDKSGSQQVATTGKKNNGQKATGKVTMSLPDCSVSQVTIPAGTAVTANGLTFITQADASLQSVKIGSQCRNSDPLYAQFATATVNVTAQVGGAQYNIAAGSFKVSGYPGVAASSSAAMSGGTDNVVQVVTQGDIDGATQKITAQNSDSVKQQLQQQIQQAGLFALTATFAPGTPNTTASSNVGDEASTVTVSQTTTYTMFGVKQADLKKLVDNDIKDKIDPAKQSILSEGLDKASFRVNSASATAAQLAMTTVATAGPDLKVNTVKQAIAGKKAGEIKTLLKADPGVTDVEVRMSPFWVTSAPSKPDKVTIIFQKAK